MTGSDGEDFPVTVEFTVIPGRRGLRDSLGGVRGAGPPLEPDEPPSVEIESVVDGAGNEVEMTEKDEDRIINECCESAADCANDLPED